jgi:2-C-methyl-D-erythritol 4-phosphate cytidylyltransferase
VESPGTRFPRIDSVVAAGGLGQRFGGGTPKQLLEVAGRPVVEWSVGCLLPYSHRVVVAVPEAHLEAVRSLWVNEEKVLCVVGGESRAASVRIAFDATSGRATDLVAVHDAARPALATEDLQRVLEAAERRGAAILGRPMSDTVKRTRGDLVSETLDRTDLFRAETPQVFARGILAEALALELEADFEPTDECSLVERLGVPIEAVPAHHPNPKMTTGADLAPIVALLSGGN